MKRFLEAAASLLMGKERRRKKPKGIGKEKPGIILNPHSSHQNDFTVDKTQNVKEGKLRDKGKLFVGGLHYATTSTELSVYFSKFGDVIHSVVVKCPKTGKSRGYGFVSFIDPADAEKALQTKEHVLHGRAIECRPFDSKDDSKALKSKEAKVFLGGLPADVTKEELEKFFSRYGKVTKVFVPIDRETKEGKGFGFITFENEDAAEKCVTERFVHLKERRVYMNKAVPRNARPRTEDEMPGSNVTDRDSFSLEDSASLQTDEDTRSSSSGQFSFEIQEHPEFQRFFENYFAEKLNYFSGMSEKEIASRKQQHENNEIENLEKFLRGLSVNSRCDLDKDLDSESADSYTSGDTYEKDCDNVSLHLPRGEFGECASINSVGKNAKEIPLPSEKERSDLKFSTGEVTEDRHNKSYAPLNFKNNTDGLNCYLCGWTSPDFENFLAHCRTLAHKTKLIERFSEPQGQETKREPNSYPSSEEPKDSFPEGIFSSKATGTHLGDSQSQNTAQKRGKVQQTHQESKQPREEPLQHQIINQEVENVEKIQKKQRKKKKKKKEEEEKMLNSVADSKANEVRNTESKKQTSQSDKQKSNQETNCKKMNNPNPMIYALAKGMACIQPLSGNKLSCSMCNKTIPESSDIGVLVMNVSHHLQSKRHLQKLLEAEEKLKSLDSKNLKPGETSSLVKMNSKEENLKEKNIPAKKKSPKDQNSLPANKASSAEEKTVLESKKPNPKDLGNNPKNAAPKKEKGKTDDSKKKISCLKCNFSSTFQEFGLHLKSERHSSSTSNAPLNPQNIEYTQCNFCNVYLFGSLYEINMHFSEHFS